jgi:hypothetical protein
VSLYFNFPQHIVEGVSALLTHPCYRTLPASSRASLLCVTLVPCAVCSLPTYNMRTSKLARGVGAFEP